MEIYKELEKNLELITKEDYRHWNLSTNTKKILCDIGLPKEPFSFIQFNIEEIENIKLDEEHIIIGTDFGTSICINSKEEIVSIDQENEYPNRFINKDLETFLEFILFFLSYENKINNATDDEIGQIIKEIKQEFHKMDRKALSGEENWWSVLLEQIEEVSIGYE